MWPIKKKGLGLLEENKKNTKKHNNGAT